MVLKKKRDEEVECSGFSARRTQQQANNDKNREEQHKGDHFESRDGVELKGSTDDIGKSIFERTYEYWPRHFTTAQKDQLHFISPQKSRRQTQNSTVFNNKKRVSFADQRPTPKEKPPKDRQRLPELQKIKRN